MVDTLEDQSILTTVKKLLGIHEEYILFDQDIILLINSAFLSLNQLGVGPEAGFSISDKDDTWGDYGVDLLSLSGLQTYVYTKVRMIFDPPQTSYAQESLRKVSDELGWRLMVQITSDESRKTGLPVFPEEEDDD